ncbi:hypothetical protein VTL71DRAFT_15760 [Oculimacula yallundae]|uniref:CBM1 domain-containing protein n=1 Tax=Oculimacula yallundae TaxID=86028 RepID=A0ABR4CCM3_9HELO
MLFGKSILVSLLALADVAYSQVVVTITSTITVITVTVSASTSTSTAYVTITGKPPPSSTSTSTRTITITATSTAATPSGNCPVEEWGQCGGQGFEGKCPGNCGNDSVCKYKDGKPVLDST